jgi:hypothetical protein
VTFQSLDAYKSNESRAMGEEAIEELEPEPLAECPREKTEVAGDDMLIDVVDVCMKLS